MAIEKVREYLKKFGAEGRIREFDVSSATVELAALATGTKPQRIAKTMAFAVGDKYVLIVCAGDVKIDNHKYIRGESKNAHSGRNGSAYRSRRRRSLSFCRSG